MKAHIASADGAAGWCGEKSMQTSSRNGFGTKLLFHRPAGDGLFEATVWTMAFYLPLFPRSTWLVRPRGMKEESISGGSSTTHYVEFLERRRTALPRVIAMYLSITGAIVTMFGPLLLGAALLSTNPELNKTWLGGAAFGVPMIWSIAMWILLDYRRDRLYQRTVEHQRMHHEVFAAGPGADPVTELDSSRLVSVLRGLRASNMSVLRASLDTPDSQIATVAKSQNDVCWSVLVEYGFARELAWDPDVLQSVPPRAKTFALTEEGRSALPRLLALACDENSSRTLEE